MGATNPVDAAAAVAVMQGVVTTQALATTTLSAGKLINGVLVLTSGGAATITTDTAANIIKGLKGCQTFEFIIDNGAGATATLAGGTGVTIIGATTTITGNAHMWSCVVTSPTTVKMYSLTTA